MDSKIKSIWQFYNFYEIPSDTVFRWNGRFWKKTDQNWAVSSFGNGLRFDTVDLVAIPVKSLVKTIEENTKNDNFEVEEMLV